MGEYMALSQADVHAGWPRARRRSRPRRPCASAATRHSSPTGPFAELKEALGGYYVFECDSIDEACTWAAKIPAARHGAIEVRPVYVDEGSPS